MKIKNVLHQVAENVKILLGKSNADLQEERAKAAFFLRVMSRVMYRMGTKHPGIECIALLDGASLLISSVIFCNASHVRWLANVVEVPLQAKNYQGMTAFDVARLKGYTAIEKILLEAEERRDSKRLPNQTSSR